MTTARARCALASRNSCLSRLLHVSVPLIHGLMWHLDSKPKVNTVHNIFRRAGLVPDPGDWVYFPTSKPTRNLCRMFICLLLSRPLSLSLSFSLALSLSRSLALSLSRSLALALSLSLSLARALSLSRCMRCATMCVSIQACERRIRARGPSCQKAALPILLSI